MAHNGELRRIAEVARRLHESCRKGASFLASHQKKAGGLGRGSILEFYKAPLALESAGLINSAHSLVDAILRYSERRGVFFCGKDEHPLLSRSFLYRNALIALGGIRLGRLDLASRERIEGILSFYISSCGAFAGELDLSQRRLCNGNHSAMGGLVAVSVGRLKVAHGVARYLTRLVDRQPQPEERFLIYSDLRGRLVSDYSPSEARWFAIDYTQEAGHFWALGVPALFFVMMHKWLGEGEYLQEAHRYLSFCDLLPERFSSWPSAGKIGWAAAEYASVTGDTAKGLLAARIGEQALIASQHEDGSWAKFYFRGPNGSGYWLPKLEITAEFTFLAGEIARSLNTLGLAVSANPSA